MVDKRKVSLYNYRVVDKGGQQYIVNILGFGYEDVEAYLAKRIGPYNIEQRGMVGAVHSMTRPVALMFYNNASESMNIGKKKTPKKQTKKTKADIPKK